MLCSLKKMNCPRKLFLLIRDYLNGRRVLIRECPKTIEKSVNRGCPQGSVLGPALWNLIFNPNRERLESMFIETIAYAGQLALNEISNWCAANKLQLAPSKCAMMLVKGNLHKKCSSEIRINGQRIKRTETFKYLGINFGTGMSVSAHVEAVANKTRELFDRLGRLARNEWGIKYTAFNGIYKGHRPRKLPKLPEKILHE